MNATTTKRATRITSAAVRAQADRRLQQKPVVVTGIGPGELTTITPKQFGKLDVDPSYQRGQTSMVAAIVRALQAGGKVFDPVTLCRRRGGDVLWIVDGYQRVCAFQQLQISFTAMVHDSESAAAEHQLFIALNTRKAVSANVIVKAWTGPAGEIIRKANESMEHPMYDRINFAQNSNENRFAASSLVRGMLCSIGASRSSGSMNELLSRLDTQLGDKHSMNRARAEHYLRLCGKICERGYIPALVLRALGAVAYRHWEREVTMPSMKVIERLREKHWAAEVQLVEKYLPIIEQTIAKVWK